MCTCYSIYSIFSMEYTHTHLSKPDYLSTLPLNDTHKYKASREANQLAYFTNDLYLNYYDLYLKFNSGFGFEYYT